MKIDARYRDQNYRIRIERKQERVEITITEPGGDERTFPVVLAARGPGRLTLEIEGRQEQILLAERGEETLVWCDRRTYPVTIVPPRYGFSRTGGSPEASGKASLKALMPGKVIAVLAREGADVEAGQGLVVIEAMKMQNELKSPRAGRVSHCGVEEGGTVQAGHVLFVIE